MKPGVVFVYGSEPWDVYIGRGKDPKTGFYRGTILTGKPGDYGNPWSHKENSLALYKVDTPEQAVSEFRNWLPAHPEVCDRIRKELRGKTLGCWCRTKKNPDAPCHGVPLWEIANL